LSQFLFCVFPPLFIVHIRMLIVAPQTYRVQIADGIVRNPIHDSLPVLTNFIPRLQREMLEESDGDWLLIWIIISQEDIIVVPVISSSNIGIACHGRFMREMVWRRTGKLGPNHESAGEQIVGKGSAL